MSSDLDERMRLFKEGQVTWPDPNLGKHCIDCRYAIESDLKSSQIAQGLRKCFYTVGRFRRKAKAFNATQATACPKFGEVE